LALSTVAVLAIAGLAATAQGEMVRSGSLIVSMDARVAPKALPRLRTAPVGLHIKTGVRSTDGKVPPSLRTITIDINRHGRLFDRGLPSCPLKAIKLAVPKEASAACGPARVGRGQTSGMIVLPGQAPLAFKGRIETFNGRGAPGQRLILAHVYSAHPVPLSFILRFAVHLTPGTFGTKLTATVPPRTRRLIHLTDLSLGLRRIFRHHGRLHSYLNADCPAPAGFHGASFPLARASYTFNGGGHVTSTLIRECTVSSG
jgi:hypothetical protein